MLSKIRLSNFRCFEKVECFLDDNTTIIVGDNAQGKTTILESVCLLMRLQSPRTSKIRDLIKIGQSNLAAEGLISDKKIIFSISGNKRKMLVQEQIYTKRKDYLKETSLVVWIGNDDILILRGSSNERRRYLDFGASQLNVSYLSALKAYKRALRARNFLLKRDASPKWDEIKPYTKLLIDNGNIIAEERRNLIEQLNKFASEYQLSVSGENEELKIIYDRCGGCDLSCSFDDVKNDELKQRQTLIGPHRDDISLQINGVNASKFASEGQQRTIVLALKMAQSAVLKNATGNDPLLLIDDIFGELDSSRRNKFLSALPKRSQKIITTTNLDWLADSQIGPYKKYLIENGLIKD
tara:strand:- start:15068 stop:16126 length:1059 start_codon:yes stop_codon:yes gene_type:complete